MDSIWIAIMEKSVNRLFEEDFVYQVVRNPEDPPDAMLLVGFGGSSSEPLHQRLYLDPSLAAYIELPESAILHVQSLPKTQSPLGGIYVWVRRDSELVETIKQAYQRLSEIQQELTNFQSDMGGLSTSPPAWPTMPTE